jgi:hypothetical protein
MQPPTRVSTINLASARQEIIHRLLAKHYNGNAYKKTFYSEKCGAICLIAIICRVERWDNSSLESTAEFLKN